MKLIRIYGTIVLLLGLLGNVFSLQAQKACELRLEGIDQSKEWLEENLSLEAKYVDSAAVLLALRDIRLQLQAQTYLAASVDEIKWKDSICQAKIYVGSAYEWAWLKQGNVSSDFLSQVGFRERFYKNKPFRYEEVVELQESLLEYAENNGFPFAEVRLDSLIINGSQISAKLWMQNRKAIVFKGVNLIGDAKISTTYLEKYLGIEKGEPYSKARVLKIRNRLKELPFLQEKSNATVTFTGGEATVNLFLARKKASRFDFLFGFLPSTTTVAGTSETVRRFQFTATLNADMYNQFGLGERVIIEFQQLRPQTQELDLAFSYPYVLNLPFGIDTKFSLYKRDTSYLDVESDLGLQYLLEGGNYLKAFWNLRSTTVLTINENVVRQSRQLPSNLDVRNSIFGLEYNWQKLDYRYNPRKGWGLNMRAGAGTKQIRKNSEIISLTDPNDLEFSYEGLYDSLTLNTFQYRLSGQVSSYLPVLENSVLKASFTGGMIISESPVYLNEQFRIGGNRLMRGYDEESIFATNYGVFTLEYRLLLGQNSYLYAFGDYGYVENKTSVINRIEHPLGFGAGITFETRVGIFGFSLALGKLPDNSYDFRNLKTHFGYVSYF